MNKTRKSWRRKCSQVVGMAAVAMVLAMVVSVVLPGLSSEPVWAADGNGSIKLHLQGEEKEPVSGAKTILYQIGVWNSSGSWDLTEVFAASGVDISDISDSEVMAELAAELYAYAVAQEILAVTAITDDEGVAVFEGLELGLYLLAQDGVVEGEAEYKDFVPFFVSIPTINEKGEYMDVFAYPKMEKLPSEPETTETEPETTETEPEPTETETEPETESKTEPETEPGTEPSGDVGQNTEAEPSSDLDQETETVPHTGSPDDPNLPVTGMLLWPITVFSILGLITFCVGWADNRVRSAKDENRKDDSK